MTPRTVDEYIQAFPKDVQKRMKVLRATIKKSAPKLGEKISWGMPTFTLQEKNLVHFAGHKKHIGFYPGADAIAMFKKDIAGFKSSKGAVQFPMDEPLPLALVARIVKFGVRDLLRYLALKAAQKQKKRH